jgi:hypothetical protein
MLTNSRNDMAVQLSKINSGLTSLQMSASERSALEMGEPIVDAEG